MRIFVLLSFLTFLVISSIFVYLGGMNDYTTYDDYLNEITVKNTHNLSLNMSNNDLLKNFAEYNDYLDLLTKNDTFYFNEQALKMRDPIKIIHKINGKKINKKLQCGIPKDLKPDDYNYADYTKLKMVDNLFFFNKINCIIQNEQISNLNNKLNEIYDELVNLNKIIEEEDRFKLLIHRHHLLQLLSNYQVLCLILSNKYFSKANNDEKLEYGNIGYICDAKLNKMFKNMEKLLQPDDKVYIRRKIYYKKNN